jgi:hypothetical protein
MTCRLFTMTWNGRNGRAEWRKKAKRYSNAPFVVSTKQLREQGYDCDDTKEGSRMAANAWWNKRLAELRLAEQRPVQPLPEKARFALGCLGHKPQDYEAVIKSEGDAKFPSRSTTAWPT